jgi:serine/threonine protein kinase
LVAADGSPRLADFGILNSVVGSNPAFSYQTGAVRWAAPELIVLQEGQTVQCATKSSDIYALGCIMLQVSVPFTFVYDADTVLTGALWQTALLVDQDCTASHGIQVQIPRAH